MSISSINKTPEGGDVKDPVYFAGDPATWVRRVRNLIPGANPIVSATLATTNIQSVVTGVVRLWEVIGTAIKLNKKPEEKRDETSSVKENSLKVTSATQHLFVVLNAGQAVAEVSGGVVGTVWSGLSIAALATTSKTVAVAAQSVGTASSGLGLALYLFMAIPQGIKAAKALKLVKDLNELEKHGTSVDSLQTIYETRPNDLKLAAPKVFAMIAEKNGSVSKADVEAVIKEARATAVFSIVVISACVISILATALGLAFTAGPGVIVAAVGCLIATLAMSGIDCYAMITYLKETSALSTKDLVVKVITIILAIATLAVTVAFAPTLALQVLGGIVGAIMIAIPIISIAVVKEKERKAAKLEGRVSSEEERRIATEEQIRMAEFLKREDELDQEEERRIAAQLEEERKLAELDHFARNRL